MDEDDSVVEIGTVTIPQMPASRTSWGGLLAKQRYKALPGGEYRMFLRLREMKLDRSRVTLIREAKANGYEIASDIDLEDVLHERAKYALLPQIEYDVERKTLTVPDVFAREASIPVAMLAADAVVPGLSLIVRIGEIAAFIAKQSEIEGTYRGVNGDHGVIEKADGSLHAVPWSPSLMAFHDGDLVRASRGDGDAVAVAKGEGHRDSGLERAEVIESGADLSRALFS